MRLKNESYPAKLDDFKFTLKGINAPISKDQDSTYKTIHIECRIISRISNNY